MSNTIIQDPEEVEIVPRATPLLSSSNCENNKISSSSLCFSIKFILKHVNRIIVPNHDYHHHDHHHDDNNQRVRETVQDVEEVFSSQPFDPDDKNSWKSVRLSLQTLGFRNKRSQNLVLRKLGRYVDDKIMDHYCPFDRNNRVIMGQHVEVSMIINRVTVDRYYHRVSIPVMVQNRHYEHQVGPTTQAHESVCVGSLKRVRVDELDGLDKKDEVCSICIEELAKEEEVTCLPCDHAFHGGCITRWFKTSHYCCPNCRFKLPVDKKSRKM